MTMQTKNDPTFREITDRLWMDQASCRGVDTERWFDPKPPKSVRRHIQAVCSTCPVARLCLSLALVKQEAVGAWGGYIMDDLRPLQRRFGAGETLSNILNAAMPEAGPSRSTDAA